MKMNKGSFHHAWGGSSVADTLGAGASPSHSAPGGFGSLDACCPGQEVPCSPSSQGVGLVRRERRQWTLCSFPGMGNRECSWAGNRALGKAYAREHPSPPVALLNLAGPAGPVGGRHVTGAARACVGPLVHLCTPCRIYSHAFTNNPTALHTRSDTLTGNLRYVFLGPHRMATC